MTDTPPDPQPLTAEEVDDLRDRWSGAPPDVLVMRLLATLDARPSGDDLVLVRRDSGGVFPDGTTNHPAIDFDAPNEPVSPSPDICEGCDSAGPDCRAIWPEQRKCCPDCSHGPGRRPMPETAAAEHRLSMDEGPDEHTPPFCECGAWWPCPDAPKEQPLEPWELELAAAIFEEEPHA